MIPTNTTKTITRTSLALLELLATKKHAMGRDDIESNDPGTHPTTLVRSLGPAVRTKKIRQIKKNGGVFYEITAYGRAILADIENWTVNDFGAIPIANPGSRPRKKKSAALAVHQPAPEPVQMNISFSADQLANHVSQVLHQNMTYRDAMLDIARRLAAFLDMELVPRKPIDQDSEQ